MIKMKNIVIAAALQQSFTAVGKKFLKESCFHMEEAEIQKILNEDFLEFCQEPCVVDLAEAKGAKGFEFIDFTDEYCQELEIREFDERNYKPSIKISHSEYFFCVNYPNLKKLGLLVSLRIA